MTVNRKFIATILGQADNNFSETFAQFSEEDQNEFIEFWAEMMAFGIRMMKELPQQEKVETFTKGLEVLPLDLRQQMCQVLVEAEEWEE